MKVAYIGKIQLSDADLSYLNEAQKYTDITYFMEVTPRFMKGPAYNISKIYPHSGVFKAIEAYPEFEKYSKIIDINKFYIVNTCGRFWQLKAFWTNLLLVIFIIKHKFDIIHLSWPANIYELFIYVFGKKSILTVHDPFPHTGLDTKIVRLRRKIAFKFIHYFIILNKAQRQAFISYYNLPENIVFNSQLSCYTFLNKVTPNYSFVPKEKYILFAGKISQYKGLDYLLPAMKRVHKYFPETKLVVAGCGSFNFDITEYKKLQYLDIRNRFIPNEELAALIKRAQFVICPYTDATQSGVIMSAFAFNIPVLATNVGGLPEMLGNGKYGLLVTPKNIEALYGGIIQLFSEASNLKEYRQNIKKDYSCYGIHSWQNIAQELMEVYKSISKQQKR